MCILRHNIAAAIAAIAAAAAASVVHNRWWWRWCGDFLFQSILYEILELISYLAMKQS